MKKTNHALNRQVAEQVMGWTWGTPKRNYDYGHHWYERRTGRWKASPKWTPTTNVVAWMQVVERIRKLGHGILISFNNWHPSRMSKGTYVRIEGHGKKIDVENESEGRAICEAAVQAVETL